MALDFIWHVSGEEVRMKRGSPSSQFTPAGSSTVDKTRSEVFQYDSSGNATLYTTSLDGVNDVSTSSSYSSTNQLTQQGSTADDGFTYEYDSEGNTWRVKQYVDGSLSRIYREFWDTRDRLVSFEERTASGTVTKRVNFTYDPHDRLVLQQVDSNADGTFEATERYVWDGDMIAMVLDQNGNVTHRFLNGPDVDQVFADETATEALWYLTDNLQSTRDVVDANGTGTASGILRAAWND